MVRFDYGIVLIANLRKEPQIFTDAKAVARNHKLSASLMEKVAQDMRSAGWLESKRGNGGGYRLVREVTLEEMARHFNPRYNFCPVIRK